MRTGRVVLANTAASRSCREIRPRALGSRRSRKNAPQVRAHFCPRVPHQSNASLALASSFGGFVNDVASGVSPRSGPIPAGDHGPFALHSSLYEDEPKLPASAISTPTTSFERGAWNTRCTVPGMMARWARALTANELPAMS